MHAAAHNAQTHCPTYVSYWPIIGSGGGKIVAASWSKQRSRARELATFLSVINFQADSHLLISQLLTVMGTETFKGPATTTTSTIMVNNSSPNTTTASSHADDLLELPHTSGILNSEVVKVAADTTAIDNNTGFVNSSIGEGVDVLTIPWPNMTAIPTDLKAFRNASNARTREVLSPETGAINKTTGKSIQPLYVFATIFIVRILSRPSEKYDSSNKSYSSNSSDNSSRVVK